MRRTTWLIAAVVIVVIALVAVTAYLAGRGASPQTATQSKPTVVSSSEAPSVDATSTDSLGAPPTGCLGGPARDDAMLLAAQRRAPHSAYGAVEVAAAIFRWAIRSPEPTESDVHGVRAVFVKSKRATAERQLSDDYRANPNPSNGLVADGEHFYLSTANGQWLVAGGSTSDRVSVEVQAAFVVNGALSPTKSLTEAFTMVWEDQGWHLDGLLKGDSQRLAAGGTQFSAGC